MAEASSVFTAKEELFLGPASSGDSLEFLTPSETSEGSLDEPRTSVTDIEDIDDVEERRRRMEELLNQRFSEVAPRPLDPEPPKALEASPVHPPADIFEKMREFEIILNERFAEVAIHAQEDKEDTEADAPPQSDPFSDTLTACEPAHSQEPATQTDSGPPLPTTARPVGGSLRELEEALARTSEPVLPRGFRDRALPAITLLAQLPGVQRALVMAEDSSGELRCVARAGIDGEDYLKRTPLHLMKSVLRTKEPVLILDATRDPRFSGDLVLRELGIASGLCVPYSDCVSEARGVLYADSLKQTNVFTHSDLGRLKEFSRRLSADQDLGEFELPKTTTTAPLPPQSLHVEAVEPFSPKWVILALCAVIMVAWPSFSNPTEKPEKKAKMAQVQPIRQVTDPKVVALSFFRALETKNYRSAYDYLSKDLQSATSLEAFGTLCDRFVDEGRNAWHLTGLSVSESPIAGSRARTFQARNIEGEPLEWQLTLARVEDTWYVTEITGISGL